MRKILVLGVATVVCATGLSGAQAAPKKKAAPKPIPLTYFLHGSQTLGEADHPPLVSDGFKVMDATAPSGSQSKSQMITNFGLTPNTKCAGNPFFPYWVGALSGEVTGPMTISLSAMSLGGSAEVRVFQDVETFACNDDFPKVAGSVTIKLPSGSGKVEAVIPSLKLKPKSSFMIQVSPVPTTPDQGRLFYDSTADPSSISFSCLPKAPKKTC